MQTQISPELIATFESEGYTNRALGNYEIERRLETHGNKLIKIDGVIMAINDDGLYSTDTTNWTLFDLLNYLNY